MPSDIRALTQHFNQPGGEIEPWMFVPASNIAEVSTTEHPGTATIRQAGRGEDIKGLLRQPIGIGDYPLPWEFQMSLVQNPMAVLLGVGDTRQNNTAIGLNVALTFSDPSTWPKDRTQRPPDTHDFQLLVIHLGNTGEFGAGLPQFAPYRTPETHLVWGRGDLAPSLNGDWNIPYFFQGSMPDAGPASPQARFRFYLPGPNGFGVGIKFNDWNEHEMRWVDCSRFGKITGVWEIGPIFSCDRWIPDVLCKQLPVLHPESTDPPEPIAPNPIHEFTVDYCAFLPCAPTAPFESFSDEFDVPGFLSWRGFQLPFQAETWSHPGQLTVTLLGASQGTWFFPMTVTEINLTAYPPPWEWEVCFTPPDPPAPWNLYFTHRLEDPQGTWKTYWQPGVIFDPVTKQARFTNRPFDRSSFDSQLEDYFSRSGQDPAQLAERVKVRMVFDPEPPQEVMQARPLRMLYQMLDKRHLRMGFRGSADGPWWLSQVMDVTEVMGGDIGQLGETCLGIVNGRHFNMPPGMPMYAQYRFDYLRFRHSTTHTKGPVMMNDLTSINAWEQLQDYQSDSNRFNLAQEDGSFVVESETTQPEGPGVISYGVIATRERHGAPGLKGTLIFEVDFVEYTNNGEYLNKYMSAIGQPSDHEDPLFGLYLMGWGITIGNRRGFVGGMDDGDRQRAVQFHFDGYSKWGFGSCMNRQISTQDQQKYPRFTQTELMERLADYFTGKETWEAAVRRMTPYRSMNDATVLSSRHYPLDEGGTGGPGVIRGRSWGHRYGIRLSDDGNTFSWLLDGKVMDSYDLAGYFSSSTDDFADGVYISIGGGAGFRKNLWRFANPRLTVKP